MSNQRTWVAAFLLLQLASPGCQRSLSEVSIDVERKFLEVGRELDNDLRSETSIDEADVGGGTSLAWWQYASSEPDAGLRESLLEGQRLVRVWETTDHSVGSMLTIGDYVDVAAWTPGAGSLCWIAEAALVVETKPFRNLNVFTLAVTDVQYYEIESFQCRGASFSLSLRHPSDVSNCKMDWSKLLDSAGR